MYALRASKTSSKVRTRERVGATSKDFLRGEARRASTHSGHITRRSGSFSSCCWWRERIRSSSRSRNGIGGASPVCVQRPHTFRPHSLQFNYEIHCTSRAKRRRKSTQLAHAPHRNADVTVRTSSAWPRAVLQSAHLPPTKLCEQVTEHARTHSTSTIMSVKDNEGDEVAVLEGDD
jgi:hypothetical protein